MLLARLADGSTFRLFGIDGARRVTLQPAAVLKGSSRRSAFKLLHTGVPPCGGFSGGGEATEGQRGQLFLFYLRRGSPGNRTLLDAIRVDHVQEERARAMLARIGTKP